MKSAGVTLTTLLLVPRRTLHDTPLDIKGPGKSVSMVVWLIHQSGNHETAAHLVALKANPYWFGHDIYTPPSAAEGGPFTIGRVIHSNRRATLAAFIGGVAVFDQPLSPEQMRTLARIGTSGNKDEPIVLNLAEVMPAK